MYISKYILTFAPVIVLTLNYSLMKYEINYVGAADECFSYIACSHEVYHLVRALEARKIKSFTISLHETEQKGGQYEQQPE